MTAVTVTILLKGLFGAIGLGHFIKRWKVFKKGITK